MTEVFLCQKPSAFSINIMYPVDSYLSRFEIKEKMIKADLFDSILVSAHARYVER